MLVLNNQNTNQTSNQAANQNVAKSLTEEKIPEPRAGRTVTVNDYAGLVSALNDADVSTIQLHQSIAAPTAGSQASRINNAGVARTVAIDGQGQYGIDFGQHYLQLTNQTKTGTSDNWNITFSNLANLNATNDTYGMLVDVTTDPTKDTVRFNNVTTSATTTGLTGKWGNRAINVNLTGTNTLNGTLSGNHALVNANNLDISGTTTVNPTSSTTIPTTNGATAFNMTGNATIESGANVTITSSARNIAGFTFPQYQPTNSQQDATVGIMELKSNANVTMTLGRGYSMAIMQAADLTLDKNSNLTVNTQLDLRGYRPAAPITLANITDNQSPYNAHLTIDQNANLTVKRTGVTVSDSPLVSMGHLNINEPANHHQFYFTVNGGSVDLEDSAYSTRLPSTYSTRTPSAGWPGILTFWGVGAGDHLNFNDAKLITIERTGNNATKPGYLLKLEGADDRPDEKSEITINTPTSTTITPFKMSTAGSSKPTTWYIQYLSNRSQGGDAANSFRKNGLNWGAGNGAHFMNGSGNGTYGSNHVIIANLNNQPGSNEFSNGQVVENNGSTTASANLNNFLNNFSWWDNKGIQFGNDLREQNTYQPVYPGTEVKQGDTKTVDVSYPAHGTTNPDTPVATYAITATDPTASWATIDSTNGQITVKPTTSVAVGMYNVPVEVTYSNDNSTSLVYAPVYVTDGNSSIKWGKKNPDGTYKGAVVVKNQAVNLHQTSDNSMVTTSYAKNGVSEFDVYTPDTTNSARLNTTPDTYTYKDGQWSDTSRQLGNVTVQWTTGPSTTVPTASLSSSLTPNVTVTYQRGSEPVDAGIIDAGTTDTVSVPLNRAGATIKNDAKLTADNEYQLDHLNSDQLSQVIDHNNLDGLPSSIGVTGYSWGTLPTITNGQVTNGGVIKISFRDNNSSGSPTYLNVAVPVSAIQFNNHQDSSKYPVSYSGISIARPNDNTTASGNDNPTLTTGMPAGTITGYALQTGYAYPAGVTNITVNPTTGNVSVTINKNAALGSFTVPVVVTYADSTTTNPDQPVVNVPVSVTGTNHDGGDVIYYGDQSMTRFYTAVASYHKTSTDYTPDTQASGFNTITQLYGWDQKGSDPSHYSKTVTYTLNPAGTEFVKDPENTDNHYPASFSANGITYSWDSSYTPNTNFGTNTGTSLANDRSQKDASGNSKYRLDFNLSPEVLNALNLRNAYSGWTNVFFNFYGAIPSMIQTFKQNQDISNLSQEQFRNMVNVTDLGQNGWNGTDVNPNAPTSFAYVPGTDTSKTFAMQWAPGHQPLTATVANNVPGTVMIVFNDGTYLNVPVTINVTEDSNNNKPDSQKTSLNQKISYQFNGQEVASYVIADIPKGSSLTAAQLRAYINNNLPNNYSIVDNYNYPAAENNITTQPAEIVVPLKQSQKQQDDSNYNAEGTISFYDNTDNTTSTHPAVPGARDIQFHFNTTTGLKAGVIRTAIENGVPAHWQVDPSFNFPGDQTANFNISVPLVHATKNVIPGHPGVTPTNPTNPNYSQLFKTATRTITVYNVPSGTAAPTIDASNTPAPQTVTFGRTGVEDEVTGDVTPTGVWYVYDGTDLTGDTSGNWAAFAVPSHRGYDSNVSGDSSIPADSPTIPAETVNPNTANVAININYEKQGDTPIHYRPDDHNANLYINRVIHYDVSGTGHAAIPNVTQTLHYIRRDSNGNSAYRDPVDGHITYVTPWTLADGNAGYGDFPAAAVTQIHGFHSLVNGTAATTVPAAPVQTTTNAQGYVTPQNGADVTITYSPVADVNVTYTFHDDTDDVTVGTPHVVSGIPGDEVTTGLRIPDHYQLAAGQTLPTTVTIPATDENVTIHLVHATHQVKPGQPGVTPTNPTNPDYKDLFKTVTRTVLIYKAGVDDQIDRTVTQPVTFGQTGTLDEVTNKIIAYGNDWKVYDTTNNQLTNDTNGSWAELPLPTHTGYNRVVSVDSGTETLPSNAPTIPANNAVTANTGNVTLSVNYEKQGNIPVPWTPNDEHANMTVTRTIHYTVPAGHPAINDQTQSIRYVRKDANGNAGYRDPVTGEIHYVTPWTVENGGEGIFPAQAVNQITGYDSYVDGTKGTEAPAANVTTQVVNGYATPQNGQTVNVTYEPIADVSVTYIFHDDTTNQNVGNPVVVSGLPGERVETGLAMPDGYKLADHQSPIPTTVVIPTAADTITIHLVHETTKVVPGQPGVTPSNPDYKDLFTTSTRTINVTSPDGSVTTIPQTITYGRSGVYDHVTHQFVSDQFGDWYVYRTDNNTLTTAKTGSWAAYSVPQITNYVSLVDNARATTVAEQDNVAPDTNTTVNVTYTDGTKDITPGVTPGADHYKDDLYHDVTRTINVYAPESDTIDHTEVQPVHFIRTGTLDLVTNQFIHFTAWTLASGSNSGWAAYTIPTHTGYNSIVTGGGLAPDTTVVPAVATITASDPNVEINVNYEKQNDIPVPYDPNDKNANMTVTRTIKYDVTGTGHAAIPDQTQTVKFIRRDSNGMAGYRDPVTNVVHYVTPWTRADGTAGYGDFPAAPVEAIHGFDSYVDNVKNTEVPATPIATAEVNNYATPQNGATVTVTYKKQNSTPIPYKPGTPDINDAMNHYVTRTIHYEVPAGQRAIADVVQTVHFVREDASGNAGYIDPVSGATTYVDWTVAGTSNQTVGAWPAHAVQQLPGYDSLVDGSQGTEVAANNNVTETTPNATVNVTYQRTTPVADVTVTYTFYDNTDHKPLPASYNKTVTGQPGQTLNTGLTVPDGYQLATGQTLPTTVTMPDADGIVTIDLVHKTQTIKPSDPGVTPNKPEYSDMFKTVSRTINVHNIDGSIDRTDQDVNFERTKTIDLVNPADNTYGAWTLVAGSASDWAEFNVPQVADYTSLVDGSPARTVAEQAVTADTPDVTVNVTYRSNTPVTPVQDVTVTYEFVDDDNNGAIVGTKTYTGQPGTTQPADLNVPDHFQLAPGQTLPATITLPALDGQTVQIHVVHKKDAVKPGDKVPGGQPTDIIKPTPKPGSQPGDNPKPTIPTQFKDLFSAVTRTIHITNPDGTTNDVHQTVVFGRTGEYDEVTQQYTGTGDWYVFDMATNTLTDQSTGTWTQYDVPQLSGYTSFVDGAAATDVASQVVNANTADVTVNVTYSNSNPTNPTGPTAPTNPTAPTSPTMPTSPTAPTSPSTPTSPTTPTMPTSPTTPTSPTAPTSPNNPTEPNNPTNPNNSDNNNGQTPGTNGNNGQPGANNTSNGENGTPTTNNTNATNGNNGVAVNNLSQTKKLPQTGNAHSNVLALVGLGLASLIGLFGLGKKRKED